MPIATPEEFAEMLDRAKAGAFAYPAINVASSQQLNAALRGFAEAESDGIVQVSWGGAEYLSGSTVKDMDAGAAALALFAREVARNYPTRIALQTDHCPPDKLQGLLLPLLERSKARVTRGEDPLFLGHMWDGSSLPLSENLGKAAELLALCAAARIVLEVEIGVVGGEEDGRSASPDAKLYSTPDDALRVAEVLGLGEKGRYLLAATFGNVHGVYAPGQVKLQPKILAQLQETVGKRFGKERPFGLVFHGGSGSLLSEIRETLDYGVVKMNVDTDTQYAFTRPIVDHALKRYDGVLKVDGGVGDKKAYDPRTWGKLAEAGMAKRVVQACEDLRSAGKRIR